MAFTPESETADWMDIGDDAKLPPSPTVASAGASGYNNADENDVDMLSPAMNSAAAAEDNDVEQDQDVDDASESGDESGEKSGEESGEESGDESGDESGGDGNGDDEDSDDDENPLADINKLGEQYPSDESDEAEVDPDSEATHVQPEGDSKSGDQVIEPEKEAKHDERRTAEDGTVTVTLDFNMIKKEGEGKFKVVGGKAYWKNAHLGDGYSNDDIFNGLVVHPNNLHGTLFLRLAEEVCTKEIAHRINGLLRCCKLDVLSENNYFQRWKNALQAKVGETKFKEEFAKFKKKRPNAFDGKIFLPEYNFLNQPDKEDPKPKVPYKQKNPMKRDETGKRVGKAKDVVDSSQKSGLLTQPPVAQSASVSEVPSTQLQTRMPPSGRENNASNNIQLRASAPVHKAATRRVTQHKTAREHREDIERAIQERSAFYPPRPRLADASASDVPAQQRQLNSSDTVPPPESSGSEKTTSMDDHEGKSSEVKRGPSYEGKRLLREESLEVTEYLEENQVGRLLAIAKQMADSKEAS